MVFASCTESYTGTSKLYKVNFYSVREHHNFVDHVDCEKGGFKLFSTA